MSRPTLFAVAAISAATLSYQVLLVRLLSIVSWYHFAYMIISIALLGFGASGTVLTLAQNRLLPHFRTAFATAAALFAATAVGSFALVARLPFNPLALVWEPGQLVWLSLAYALLVLPFFFGGGAVGLAFTRRPEGIGQLYAYDLIGAGIGSLGVTGLLFFVTPPTALRLVAALGFASALLVLLPSAGRLARFAATFFGLAAFGVALWLPPSITALHPRITEYKGLPMALRVPGARIVEERSSPLGLVSVVESPTIPFRHAPGLSLSNPVEPPEQVGVFVDGDSLSAITRFDGDLEPLRYLDFTTAALPYHLLDSPEVLILGAGGGEQVLLALFHGAPEIDAVELNPQIVDLVEREYADFSGSIYRRPEVDLHLSEARSFVARTAERFDLIQVPPLYSFGAAAGGTVSLLEGYTFTVEAMREFLGKLKPGGLLSVTLWLKLPPRDTLKLVATAVEALEAEGVAAPGERLALIRSWSTTTLIVKNGALNASEIEALRAFAVDRSFDVAWYPGIKPEEVNRFNLLEEPWFFQGARALVGPGAEDYIRRYKFAIEPATDDRPYFHDFFRWRSLPELLGLRTQGAAAMLDMGYLILFATLAQAGVLSLVLILAPLALWRRALGGRAARARVALYFFAIGLAFLFLEIAYIQRFMLFLGHPLYAVATVLAAFLVFAGVGSAMTPRLDAAFGRLGLRAHQVAVFGIAVIATGSLFLLAPVFDALVGWSAPAKVAVSLLLIAPLTFLMGMPFPLGIRALAGEARELVPWAWAINGCASVISAVVATLLAMHFGFRVVVGLAVALYLTTLLTRGR